jgi:hypothetical protein
MVTVYCPGEVKVWVVAWLALRTCELPSLKFQFTVPASGPDELVNWTEKETGWPAVGVTVLGVND